MSINGIRHSLGGALPTTPHDQAGGLGSGTRMPHAGQVAALVGRPPQRASDGPAAPRAPLSRLTQGLGQKLESARIATHVLNLVRSGEVDLRGNYSDGLLAKVADVAANRLADLKRDFRV
jgi:hypothetical protein